MLGGEPKHGPGGEPDSTCDETDRRHRAGALGGTPLVGVRLIVAQIRAGLFRVILPGQCDHSEDAAQHQATHSDAGGGDCSDPLRAERMVGFGWFVRHWRRRHWLGFGLDSSLS